MFLTLVNTTFTMAEFGFIFNESHPKTVFKTHLSSNWVKHFASCQKQWIQSLEWLNVLSFQNKTADVEPVLWNGSAAQCRYGMRIISIVLYFHELHRQSDNIKFYVTGKSKRSCSISEAERDLWVFWMSPLMLM